MEKPVICTANQNGSQADCELGNPFKRDSKVDACPVPFTCSSWHSAVVPQISVFSHNIFPFVLNQTTFYIILSTAGMTLDTTEIDIDLQLQT